MCLKCLYPLCNKQVMITDDVPVILWITFDGFCKHTDSLRVLPLLHKLYPFFYKRKKKSLVNNSLVSQ